MQEGATLGAVVTFSTARAGLRQLAGVLERLPREECTGRNAAATAELGVTLAQYREVEPDRQGHERDMRDDEPRYLSHSHASAAA